ncbi:MAG: hypothetical protein PHT02_10325 [Tissierellia bacterium]|nr:hypothetical protein [Tissierellia bacterium]
MNIPSILANAKLINPPYGIVEFCESVSPAICVYFYEDKCVQQSYRFKNDIFINIKGTYWFNYVSPPYGAETFGEVIVLRILHELGHVQNNHAGTLIDIGNKLQEVQDKNFVEKCENEAWKWALEFRYNNNLIYNKLVSICTEFSNTYQYVYKDWKDDYKNQFKYRFNKEPSESCLLIEKNKFDYFGKLIKCPLNYRIL